MITAHIDLGQLLISSLIAMVAFFIKRIIDRMEERIDKHEGILFNMNGNLQLIMGQMGIERRQSYRREQDNDPNQL